MFDESVYLLSDVMSAQVQISRSDDKY